MLWIAGFAVLASFAFAIALAVERRRSREAQAAAETTLERARARVEAQKSWLAEVGAAVERTYDPPGSVIHSK